MKFALLAALALLSPPLLSAQSAEPAPASVADSLVEIRSRASVFSSHQLILLRADGSYQEIINEGVTNSVVGLRTNPPSSGTYTYATSPGVTGQQGTITFAGTPSLAPIGFGGGTGGLESPTVTVYPSLAITGALNVSNNSWISAAHPTTPGFVIVGAHPRWVLARGDGPSLSQFGVASPVSIPAMEFSGAPDEAINIATVTGTTGQTLSQTILAWSSDPNLEAGLQAIFATAGAFPFPAGSSDCAALVLLEPGAYTVRGATPGADGELLTEVYVLPFGK